VIARYNAHEVFPLDSSYPLHPCIVLDLRLVFAAYCESFDYARGILTPLFGSLSLRFRMSFVIAMEPKMSSIQKGQPAEPFVN